MKIAPLIVAVSLLGCGSTQELSSSEQEFAQLTDELRAASNCGRQNADCHHSDASVPDCRSDMRACIAACSHVHHSPAIDALHACNAAYDACAGDDDWDDDGGLPADCEAQHRACLCTVFTDAWNEFCANVELRCANDTSRTCARLIANCAEPTPPMPGVCR